jgi:hypothetical protein
MLGFDPNNPNAPTWAIEPILKRMRESYRRTAIGIVLSLQEDKDSPEGLKVSNFMELMGRKLTFFYLETNRQSSELRPSDDVMTRLSEGFEQDTFRRPEIARWLSLFQIESQYQFDMTSAPEPTAEPKPLAPEPTQIAKTSIVEMRAKRLVKIAIGFGYSPPNLPKRVGRNPGPKPKILAESLKHKDLSFTPATSEAAWELASKMGWLRDGGLTED